VRDGHPGQELLEQVEGRQTLAENEKLFSESQRLLDYLDYLKQDDKLSAVFQNARPVVRERWLHLNTQT